MTLPIKDYVLSSAVQSAVQKAKTLRDNVQVWKSLVDAGCTADVVFNALAGIKTGRDILASFAAMGGIDAAAREEYNDPALNFSAELNAVVSACDGCMSWISANFPKDGTGYVLRQKIVNNAVQERSFTGAALAGLSGQLAALLAAFS